MASLVLICPLSGTADTTFPLAGHQVVLGRGSGCAIRIEGVFVSRRHACVYFDGDAWVVEDLQSTNGCYVNELPVRGRSVLRESDFIKIGDVILKFHLGGGFAIPPADDDGGSGAPADLTLRLSNN